MKRTVRISEGARKSKSSAPQAGIIFDNVGYRTRAEALLEVSSEIRRAILNLRRWPVHGAGGTATRVRRMQADRHLDIAMQNLLRLEDLARQLTKLKA